MITTKKWGREWTPSEDRTLTLLWNEGLTAGHIADKLDRTRNAVIGRAHRLNLSHPNGRGRRAWTKRELRYLRDEYAPGAAPEIAKVLGRTVHAIRMRASNMGLTREAAE